MNRRLKKNIRALTGCVKDLAPLLQALCVLQNVVVYFLMSVCVSVVLYRNKMHEVKKNTLIKRKNKELEMLNTELGQLNSELEKMSTIDFLTNVANRRKFEEVLKTEWDRAIRGKLQISVIILDIDYFKQYNDFYGHTKGDECLQTIGRVLSDTVKRKYECVARYGGEEFACILPNTDEMEGVRLCELIRKAIISAHIPHEKSTVAPVITASFGLATASPKLYDSLDGFIKAADNALYTAKTSGRNKVASQYYHGNKGKQ